MVNRDGSILTSGFFSGFLSGKQFFSYTLSVNAKETSGTFRDTFCDVTRDVIVM